MQFIFIKPDLRQDSSNHYAGGKHGFSCAAQALAAAGHSVHLLYTCTKPELLFNVMQHSSMGSLAYSTAVEGVAVWSAGGITHHASLSDVQASTQQELSTAMAALCDTSQGPSLNTATQRLLDESSSLLNAHMLNSNISTHGHAQGQQQQQGSKVWIVLDADGSQETLTGSSSSLMEACAAAFPPSMLLLLVQNIHFLPLGPQGTAARSPALLHSWTRLGGVLCVSAFVARYIAQYAVPLGLAPERIHCVHYAAFGAFGSGPFPDYGTAAAQHLPWPSSSTSSSTSPGSQHSSSTVPQHQPSWRPTVGCLKLTPEKGGSVFLDLARALPQLQFLAVCADPALQAAAAQLHNVRTVPPGDLDSILQHMTVVMAPSLWQEAYGMVVTEALLRGLPVLVSDQGGLAEAALGCAAAVVPVRPLELPEAVPGGGPSWQGRVLPQDQDLTGWCQALQKLLGDRGVYEACSRAGRGAGLRWLGQQGQQLQQLVEWIDQL